MKNITNTPTITQIQVRDITRKYITTITTTT